MLNSERLTWVVALAPQASTFSIGWGWHLKWVMSSVTCFVTPLIVRSPTRLTGWSPLNAIMSDLNVIVGYLAVSKKSAACRCSLNSAWPVLTEVASMVTMADPAFAARSRITLPLVLSNLWVWLEKPRWL